MDPIKQEVRQIRLAKDVLHNNDNIGDILLKNTHFGSKRKKADVLQYVNKYLSSSKDFPFNSADESNFKQVNKTLIGKQINKDCFVMYEHFITLHALLYF